MDEICIAGKWGRGMTKMRYFLLVVMSFWMGGLQAVRLEGKLPSLEVSDGEVLSGVWNSDVDRVLQKAREENRPTLIVYAKRGCPHCSRLLASMKSETFLKWQRERNIFMSLYHKKPNISLNGRVIGNGKEGKEPLRKELAHYRGKAPLVCVYWPRSDGTTIKKMFSGIRGEMLGQKHEKLECELIQAVDGLLDGYCVTTNTVLPLKDGGVPIDVHDTISSNNNNNSNEVLK